MNDRLDALFERGIDGALAIVGVGGLVLSVTLVTAPERIAGPVAAALPSSLATPGFALLAAVVLAVTTAYRFVTRAPPTRPSVGVPTPPSERDRSSEADRAGSQVDEYLATIGGESDDAVDRVDLAITKDRVEERVRDVAVDVVMDTESCSRRTASRLLESGTWTDRPRARVFLGGESVPDLPLSTRVRDWASGEAFERQVQATVEELADRAGVDVEDSLAPATPVDGSASPTPDAGAGDRAARDARAAVSDLADAGDPGDESGFYRRDVFDEADAGDDGDAPGEDRDVATEWGEAS